MVNLNDLNICCSSVSRKFCMTCVMVVSGQPRDEKGRQAGQVHYENLCMKAVNQSIGM